MTETIGAPRPARPELGLVVRARREGWSRAELTIALLAAMPTASTEEVARLVELTATPEAGRRGADPRLA